MHDNLYRNFILNNSLAAISAVPDSALTFATDGNECLIHEFDSNGNFNQYHETFRPYRRLRAIDCSDGYTAMECCAGRAKLYYLSDSFREEGFVELDTTGSRSNSCSTLGELTDASLTDIGNDTYIIGSFRKSAHLFDTNGKRLTRLCTADDDEILTDFVSLGNGTFAMGTLCGTTQTVSVSDGDNIQTAILSRNYVLRMLIPNGEELYALFGRSYIYNHIIKIYSNGILTLPKG